MNNDYEKKNFYEIVNNMKLKMIKNILRGGFALDEGETYEVDSVVVDSYKIKIPMRQKNRFKYVLVNEDEGELVDE